jgi:hypothetical protein
MHTLTAALFCLTIALPAAAQTTVRYEPKESDLKYAFGVGEPVARVKPGDIIDTKTFDCFVNKIQKPGDTLAKVTGDNPLTGPFYVEGAEPGDTLVVKILQLDVDGSQGVGALAPGFGALNSTNYTPMLHAPVPEKIWFYPIDRAKNEATFTALDSAFSVRIPLHPFLGCLGVAPALESRSSIVPAEHGATWTRRRRAPATPPTSPSTSRAPCSISATATRRWETAKSPAPRSRCRCMRGCRWT